MRIFGGVQLENYFQVRFSSGFSRCLQVASLVNILFFLGEFHLRLRHLEKSLLQALNDAKGRILDDDR